MRILFINSLYAPESVGGAERMVQAQAKAMQSAGYEVGVLCLSADAGLRTQIVNGIRVWKAGLRNVYFPFKDESKRRCKALRALWHAADVYNPWMRGAVRDVIQCFRPDVASVHNLAGWSIAAWDVLRRSQVPIVQVLHDQYLLCPNAMMFKNGRRCERPCAVCRMSRSLHKRRSAQVDTVVSVSRFIEKKMWSHGVFEGVRSSRCIHNVHNLGSDPIAVQRPWDGIVTFGFIGRISEAKGIEFLLKNLCRRGGREWRLLIAGSGEERYVEWLRSEYGGDRIQFLGYTSAEEFFPLIDVCVIPSLWEDTLPSVAFESLLYGRPVLGSRIGGIPEMVNAGNGILFEPGDGADLIRCVDYVIGNHLRFRSETLSIQASAAQYKDRANWCASWGAVYKEAIQHGNGKHALSNLAAERTSAVLIAGRDR